MSPAISDSPPTSISQRLKQRQDFWVWLASLIFIAALIGAIFGLGAYRGWDAAGGHTHNMSFTSSQRFWSEPSPPELGVSGRYGTDATGRWYYWKLPPDAVTPLSRAIMWLAYCLHQFLYWIGLYCLQRRKMAERKDGVKDTPSTAVYSAKLGFWNWYLIAINIVFHLIHLGQTHWTYDALAQDTSISSSQSSVIMLLIFIMVIEYRDRGLFFGWPSQFDNGRWSVRLRLPYSPMLLVRRYHGYAFAWAAIYTFWYHPMENTLGHAMGFFHTYVILLQGSLAYTPFHLNKYWRFLLEVWVTAHGGVVAAQTGGPEMLGTKLWPMFVFGFLLLIVLTQLFGLPFWRRIPAWVRIFPLLLYLAIVIYMYSWIPDNMGRPWVRMQEIIRIPGVYYLYFFVVWAWTLLLLLLDNCCRPSEENETKPVGSAIRVLCLVGVVLIYFVFVGISTAIQIVDVKMNMIMLMIALTGLFACGCCVTNILFQIVFNTKESCQKRKDFTVDPEKPSNETEGEIAEEKNEVKIPPSSNVDSVELSPIE